MSEEGYGTSKSHIAGNSRTWVNSSYLIAFGLTHVEYVCACVCVCVRVCVCGNRCFMTQRMYLWRLKLLLSWLLINYPSLIWHWKSSQVEVCTVTPLSLFQSWSLSQRHAHTCTCKHFSFESFSRTISQRCVIFWVQMLLLPVGGLVAWFVILMTFFSKTWETRSNRMAGYGALSYCYYEIQSWPLPVPSLPCASNMSLKQFFNSSFNYMNTPWGAGVRWLSD